MSFYTKKVESDFEHELVNPTAIDGDLSRGYDRALDALLKKHNSF
jgi:hypothetical protein